MEANNESKVDAAFELLCNCACGCQEEIEEPKHLEIPFMNLMHEYNESRKEQCTYIKQLEAEMIPIQIRKLYPTGTTYEGMANLIGLTIYGTYTMPHGVAYKGELDEEGMFHGEGELIYPSGNVLRGKWNHGDFTGKRQLFFNDYIVFLEDNWTYCHMPDRRFSVELVNGLQPGGNSYVCAHEHVEVPLGYYDCGQGFYLPSFKCIYSHDDITEIVRSPAVEEQQWIIRNCRKSPDLPVGPIPDFYDTYYKPTPHIDPTYEGDSDQSPEISYINEDAVSTLSAASAARRWNRFHLMSIDSWLERAAHYYRSSVATHTSAESEADVTSTTQLQKPAELQRSTSHIECIEEDKAVEARRRISLILNQFPEIMQEKKEDSSEAIKSPPEISAKLDFDKLSYDKLLDHPKSNAINVFRRSSSAGKLPHSVMKTTSTTMVGSLAKLRDLSVMDTNLASLLDISVKSKVKSSSVLKLPEQI